MLTHWLSSSLLAAIILGLTSTDKRNK